MTIPSSVTTIGDHAFWSCKSLESVILPSSVSSIGRGAFYLCSKITEPIYNANCFAYLPTSYKGSYTIPNGIKQIAGWAFKNCGGLTTVNIPSSVTTIDEGAFWNCYELSSITIPNSVQIIGESAFATCISLTSFIIPPTVKTIGDYAFQFCRMSSITSYATTPPACGEKCFERIGKSIPVYVPMYSISAYKQAEGWKEFTNILPIAAEDVPIIEPIITTDDYSVTIIWPQNEDADTYTIEITKDGVVFCTLKFNANGQLTGIAFAPGRDGSHHLPAATMVANGWQFTVTGLNTASKYGFTLDAKDNSQQIIKSYSGLFATTGYQAAIYTLTLSVNDATMGTVSGAGEYGEFDKATATATANGGYEFVQWSNGVTDNPYTFSLESDVELEAVFVKSETSLSGLENPASTPVKFFQNGQMYILRDGKTYTVQGVEIE